VATKSKTPKKPSKKDIRKRAMEIYTKAIGHFSRQLGMGDWEYSVYEDEKSEAFRGRVECNMRGRMAEIDLSMKWIERSNPSKSSIEETAYHECLEVLLMPIRDMLEMYYSKDVVDTEIHKIIRRIENAHFVEIDKQKPL
jgi:hypothetical protein